MKVWGIWIMCSVYKVWFMLVFVKFKWYLIGVLDLLDLM